MISIENINTIKLFLCACKLQTFAICLSDLYNETIVFLLLFNNRL